MKLMFLQIAGPRWNPENLVLRKMCSMQGKRWFCKLFISTEARKYRVFLIPLNLGVFMSEEICRCLSVFRNTESSKSSKSYAWCEVHSFLSVTLNCYRNRKSNKKSLNSRYANAYNYFRIPDSPSEPDPEVHPTTDPKIIPLDDITGNSDSISNFQNIPWPEPKPALVPPSPPQTQQMGSQHQQHSHPQQGPHPQGFTSGYSTVGSFPGYPQMGMPGIMPPGQGNWRVRTEFVFVTNSYMQNFDRPHHRWFCYKLVHVLILINKYFFEVRVFIYFSPSLG